MRARQRAETNQRWLTVASVALWSATLLLVILPAATLRRAGSVEGQLVDEATGRPVAGMVQLTRSGGRDHVDLATDSTGRFRYARVSVGTYVLQPYPIPAWPVSHPAVQVVRVTAGGRAQADFRLVRSPRERSLAIRRVTVDAGGRLGVEVWLGWRRHVTTPQAIELRQRDGGGWRPLARRTIERGENELEPLVIDAQPDLSGYATLVARLVLEGRAVGAGPVEVTATFGEPGNPAGTSQRVTADLPTGRPTTARD